MPVLLRSLYLLLLFACPAYGQTLGLPESSSEWLINLLIALVFSLIGLTWRSHKSEYSAYKTELDRRITKIETKQESSLDKDDHQRMQLSLHQSIDSLRGDFNRWRTEDNSANTRLVNELYEDIKEQRQEQRHISEEVWRQIAEHREKFSSFEVRLVGAYHTKQEIVQLFDDKLQPVLDQLKRLSSSHRGTSR